MRHVRYAIWNPSSLHSVVELRPNGGHSKRVLARGHCMCAFASRSCSLNSGSLPCNARASPMLDHTARVTAEGLAPNTAKCWNTFRRTTGCWCAPASAGVRAWSASHRRRRPGFAGRLRAAHRQAGDFQSSRKRGPVPHARVACRARHSPRNERHSARRWLALWRARSRQPVRRRIHEHDIAFLQGAANILGMAIEQQQYQRKLQSALARHQILLKEVNHRVKNSLQVVSSMLHCKPTQSETRN